MKQNLKKNLDRSSKSWKSLINSWKKRQLPTKTSLTHWKNKLVGCLATSDRLLLPSRLWPSRLSYKRTGKTPKITGWIKFHPSYKQRGRDLKLQDKQIWSPSRSDTILALRNGLTRTILQCKICWRCLNLGMMRLKYTLQVHLKENKRSFIRWLKLWKIFNRQPLKFQTT